MFFQQFSLPSLGHASYLVGDETTGQALVFDPRRDVEIYTGAAREQGLRITYAADSHGHNDYLSGLSELHARTGADLWGSAPVSWATRTGGYATASSSRSATSASKVLHTPGNTSEHISFPPPMGGSGAAPNPLAYCLWGWIACYAMTFATEAARDNVELAVLRGTITTEVDQTRALGVIDNPRSSRSTGRCRSRPMHPTGHSRNSRRAPMSAAPASIACAIRSP